MSTTIHCAYVSCVTAILWALFKPHTINGKVSKSLEHAVKSKFSVAGSIIAEHIFVNDEHESINLEENKFIPEEIYSCFHTIVVAQK